MLTQVKTNIGMMFTHKEQPEWAKALTPMEEMMCSAAVISSLLALEMKTPKYEYRERGNIHAHNILRFFLKFLVVLTSDFIKFCS